MTSRWIIKPEMSLDMDCRTVHSVNLRFRLCDRTLGVVDTYLERVATRREGGAEEKHRPRTRAFSGGLGLQEEIYLRLTTSASFSDPAFSPSASDFGSSCTCRTFVPKFVSWGFSWLPVQYSTVPSSPSWARRDRLNSGDAADLPTK